jgi:hypothetical protein
MKNGDGRATSGISERIVEFARRAKALGRLSGHIISMSSGQHWGPMPGEPPTPQLKAQLKPLRLALRLSWLL